MQVSYELVGAYQRVINEEPLTTNSDWDAVIGFINQYQLVPLIERDLFRLQRMAQNQNLHEYKWEVLKWRFHIHLFNFEWKAARDLLFQMVSTAEEWGATNPNAAYYGKWALSRIALFYWLVDGDTN
ncbi:hypothetical protein RZS08_19155, partial [Arthrospira platensis SPKY1]|nr:hypothetical protein [Arthrospira platensis SPKY1]